MRRIVVTAALAISVALAGLAYAATTGGPTTDDSSVVSTLTRTTDPATSSSPSPGSSSPTSSATPTGSADDDRGGHGADGPVTHDAGTASAVPTTTGHRRSGSDDGPGHDVGDDHGSGGHGSDD